MRSANDPAVTTEASQIQRDMQLPKTGSGVQHDPPGPVTAPEGKASPAVTLRIGDEADTTMTHASAPAENGQTGHADAAQRHEPDSAPAVEKDQQSSRREARKPTEQEVIKVSSPAKSQLVTATIRQPAQRPASAVCTNAPDKAGTGPRRCTVVHPVKTRTAKAPQPTSSRRVHRPPPTDASVSEGETRATSNAMRHLLND
jgi:hypothetical protein